MRHTALAILLFTASPAAAQLNENQQISFGGGMGLAALWIANAAVAAPAGTGQVRCWGLPYGPCEDVPATAWDDFRNAAWVPVVGPWIQLANQPSAFADDAWGPYLIVDGLLQAAALSLIVIGIVLDALPPPSSPRPVEREL